MKEAGNWNTLDLILHLLFQSYTMRPAAGKISTVPDSQELLNFS